MSGTEILPLSEGSFDYAGLPEGIRARSAKTSDRSLKNFCQSFIADNFVSALSSCNSMSYPVTRGRYTDSTAPRVGPA